MARQKHPPIEPGKVYGTLEAIAEDAGSARYPSQRWWHCQCTVCGADRRVQAGFLHLVARGPGPRVGSGCAVCEKAKAIATVNANLTAEQRQEHSRRMHESMTPEERSARAAKGGHETAGKPRNRKPKQGA